MKAAERRDKRVVDRISAAILLQGWLDRHSGTAFAVDPEAVPPSRSRKTGRSGRHK